MRFLGDIMRVLKSLAASLFAVLTLTFAAQAGTIATFNINNGLIGVTETRDSGNGDLLGSAFFLSGLFEGDATGILGLEGVPNELNFGATLTIQPPLGAGEGAEPLVIGGQTGPIPLEFLAFAFGELLLDLEQFDLENGGILTSALDYILDGEDRVNNNPTEFFNFGYGQLFFTYGLDEVLNPLQIGGSFSAIVSQLDTSQPSIPELISLFLGFGPLGDPELPVLLNEPQSGPPETSTFALNFDLELTISTIPVPAGLPLLGVGLLGFAVLRRRRKVEA